MSASALPNTNTLYRLAEPQAGYFTTRQAAQAGFTRPLLAHHARSGRFLRIKHGIYRLAHFPAQPHADLVVAWLEAGPSAVLSHESALALYDLSDHLPAAIHLTVPRTASRRHAGLRLHTRRLAADEVTRRAGLPVTSVPRTLADLAAAQFPNELIRQAAQEAVQRGLVTRRALNSYAERRGGQVARVLRAALEPAA